MPVWHNRSNTFIQVCRTDPKVRLRLPKAGNEEILKHGNRLVLLPKLAFFALLDKR